MAPVSWVYLLTNDPKDVEASFVQTIIVLPVVVAGIAMIVQNSLAAGIQPGRYRRRRALSLRARHTGTGALHLRVRSPSDLASGISALEVATIISVFFVYVTMVLWKLDYGEHLNSSFLSLFTGRRGDD